MDLRMSQGILILVRQKLRTRIGCSYSNSTISKLIPKQINIIKKEEINKSKQASIIKNLHRQNKNIFGELWETKKEKLSKSKIIEKEQLNSSSSSSTESADSRNTLFIEVKQVNEGPKSIKRKQNTLIISKDKLKIDPTINIQNNERSLGNSAESNWISATSSNKIKRLNRITTDGDDVSNPSKESKFSSKSQMFQKPVPFSSSPQIQRDKPEVEYTPKEIRDFPNVNQLLASINDCLHINQYGEFKLIRKDVDDKKSRKKKNNTVDEIDPNLVIDDKKEGVLKLDFEVGSITTRSKRIKEKTTTSSHDSFKSDLLKKEKEGVEVNEFPHDMISTISTHNELFPFDNPIRSNNNYNQNNINHIITFTYPSSSSCDIKYPSVTRILSSTMSQQQIQILKKWEEKMIQELGENGFKEYKEDLFRNGKELHSKLQEILSGKSVSESDISIPIQGHWNSLQNIIKQIKNTKVLESYVTHPKLHYSGIVDCVGFYKDKLVLIDWKTSEKPKPFISNTYDTPTQIAAYIGAINYDPKYTFKVSEGLVVIAYKDGKESQLFHLDSNILQKYWKLWMKRLKLYQSTIQ